MLDGDYAPGPGAAPRFHPLPPPDDAEVARVASQVARRLARLLERRGLGAGVDPVEADPLADQQPFLSGRSSASMWSPRRSTRWPARWPLCRYVARPPVATERLSRLTDGRLLYRLKHRWRDGTTHVVFEPAELVRVVRLLETRRLARSSTS